ncbi:hypothetical protein BH24CHL1_BH24CHL1_14550 [soil metagenome]
MRSAQRQHAIEIALILGKLLDECETMPQNIPDESNESGVTVSHINHHEDVYLSTLRSYIEMLGGELTINAIFPDQTVALVPDDTPE